MSDFPYTVELTIPFEAYRASVVTSLTPWRDTRQDPAEPARLWCAKNITPRQWTASNKPEPVVRDDELVDLDDLRSPVTIVRMMTGRYAYTFRFERQEDAALFKMFWSEGA